MDWYLLVLWRNTAESSVQLYSTAIPLILVIFILIDRDRLTFWHWLTRNGVELIFEAYPILRAWLLFTSRWNRVALSRTFGCCVFLSKLFRLKLLFWDLICAFRHTAAKWPVLPHFLHSLCLAVHTARLCGLSYHPQFLIACACDDLVNDAWFIVPSVGAASLGTLTVSVLDPQAYSHSRGRIPQPSRSFHLLSLIALQPFQCNNRKQTLWGALSLNSYQSNMVSIWRSHLYRYQLCRSLCYICIFPIPLATSSIGTDWGLVLTWLKCWNFCVPLCHYLRFRDIVISSWFSALRFGTSVLSTWSVKLKVVT